MPDNPASGARRAPRSISSTRKVMLSGSVVLAFLIGLRHTLPGGESTLGSLDAFCPFGGVETLLPYIFSGRTLKSTNLLNFSLLIGVLGLSLVAGRAFCGWMCPLGALQEFLASLARRLTGEKRLIRGKPRRSELQRSLPPSIDQPLRSIKYLVLLLVLAASPFVLYPTLREFCAVRGVFGFHLTALLVGVLNFFVFASLLVERAWCKYFCPLGALLAVFNRFSPLRIVVDTGRCNACGRCDIDCSMGISQVSAQTQSAECIRCLECLDTCAREGSLTLRVG